MTNNDIFGSYTDAQTALIESCLSNQLTGAETVRNLDFFYDVNAIAEHCLYPVGGGWSAHPAAIKREVEMHKYTYTGRYTFVPEEGGRDGDEIVKVLVEVLCPKIGTTFNLNWGRVAVRKDAPHSCRAVSGMLDGLEWASDLDLLAYVKRLVMELSDN